MSLTGDACLDRTTLMQGIVEQEVVISEAQDMPGIRVRQIVDGKSYWVGFRDWQMYRMRRFR
jgi:hypothetical protein